MIYTSIKQLKIAADLNYADLSLSQLIVISKGKVREVACFCKYGYTNAALFKTCLGLIFCASYDEYVQMLNNIERRGK